MKPGLALGILTTLGVGLITLRTDSNIGAFILMGGFALWVVLDPSNDLRVKSFLASCAPLILGPSLLLISGIRGIESQNYDWLLHDADSIFGFCPSCFIYQHCPLVLKVGLGVIYLSLPTAVIMSLVWALQRQEAKPLITALLFGVFVAPIFYALLPASGPAHPGSGVPNCIPSVHFSTALVLWYFNRRIGKGFGIASLVFAVLTGFSTITTGEHYLIDLVVAIPFAMLCIDVGLLRNPITANRPTCERTTTCGKEPHGIYR